MRFELCEGRRQPKLRNQQPPSRLYDEAVVRASTILWKAADRVCGKRLKCAIPTPLDAMERHGHLQPSPEVRRLVLAASAATIDRVLALARQSGKQGRRRTSINTPLRKSMYCFWLAYLRMDRPALSLI
jgi:hypothetical protein